MYPRSPVSLPRLSIKLTNDPPEGDRASMKRTVPLLMQQAIDTVEQSEWHRLLSVLAFFDTTVQERRKFGPLRWAIHDQFTKSGFTRV
jgi:dynein heavy chain